jgi:hypothetical protein
VSIFYKKKKVNNFLLEPIVLQVVEGQSSDYSEPSGLKFTGSKNPYFLIMQYLTEHFLDLVGGTGFLMRY